jgi:hypothetical protein
MLLVMVHLPHTHAQVFALFVKTPAKAFRKDEAKLRHIIDTFKLL